MFDLQLFRFEHQGDDIEVVTHGGTSGSTTAKTAASRKIRTRCSKRIAGRSFLPRGKFWGTTPR